MLTTPFFSSIVLLSLSPSVTDIRLMDRNIRVSDIADSSSSLSNEVISVLPLNAKKVMLSEKERLTLLRKRFPTYNFNLLHSGNVHFSVSAKKKEAPQSGECYRLRSPISKDAYITKENLESLDCRNKKVTASIRFDRGTRMSVANEGLETGTYLGRILLNDTQIIRKGSKLTLVAEHGPVIIQRQVTALQPSRHGQNIFVKTEDGKVISSKLAIKTNGGINEKTR